MKYIKKDILIISFGIWIAILIVLFWSSFGISKTNVLSVKSNNLSPYPLKRVAEKAIQVLRFKIK